MAEFFYVTVRDGERHGFMLGPYDTHAEALNNVVRGTALANTADPRAHWYAFGTAKVTTENPPKSVFGK